MTQKHMTADQAKAALRRSGVTLRDFAQRHGFPVAQVYAVVNGRVKGTRGQGHQIAVALGMK